MTTDDKTMQAAQSHEPAESLKIVHVGRLAHVLRVHATIAHGDADSAVR